MASGLSRRCFCTQMASLFAAPPKSPSLHSFFFDFFPCAGLPLLYDTEFITPRMENQALQCSQIKKEAKEDGNKPGLEAMLQKVLQFCDSRVLSKRSYAKKGDEVSKAEQFLEILIKAPEDEWNKLLINGLTIGKGEISPEELYAVINKRIERILIRTEGGSYQQHILNENLKGIQSRAEEIVQVLHGKS